MTVSAAEVRIWPLNNMPASDIADTVITSAVLMASSYVDGVKRVDATSIQIDNAVKALGGYLAYISYLGHQVSDVAGAFTDGYFEPSAGTQGVPLRVSNTDAREKTKFLYSTAQMFLGLVSSVTDEGPQKARRIPLSGTTYRQKDL